MTTYSYVVPPLETGWTSLGGNSGDVWNVDVFGTWGNSTLEDAGQVDGNGQYTYPTVNAVIEGSGLVDGYHWGVFLDAGSLTNYGTVSTSAGVGAISVAVFDGVIDNYGVIAMGASGGTGADGSLGVFGNQVFNAGTITSSDIGVMTRGVLINAGVIDGTGVAVLAGGDPVVETSVTNTGGGVIRGDVARDPNVGGYGYGFNNAGFIFGDVSNADSVANSGTIQGTVGAGEVTNGGSIDGAVSAGSLTNTGTIDGDVTVGASSVNHGAINGSLSFDDGNDTYNGSGGHVTGVVSMGGGDDTVWGGASTDTIQGGAGNDVLYASDPRQTLYEAAGGGDDTVYSSVSYILKAGQEIEHLKADPAFGNTPINLKGNEFASDIVGNDADNVLEGGGGADTLQGMDGDDRYRVTDLGTVVIEGVDQGYDTVITAVSYALPDNVEVLRAMHPGATDPLSLTGNALDNLVVGNAGDNTLDGGAGADTMKGGQGNDTYHVDSLDDVVVEHSGGGQDTIVTSVSLTLSANVEVLEAAATGAAAVDLTGNGVNNLLIGAGGNNVLDGGAGADTMQGAKGDDTYFVDNAGDKVVERTNSGTDQVFASVSFTLSANVENLTLTGSQAVNATGNGTANALVGNDAANVLDGGLGSDTLSGHGGADVFVFDSSLGASNVDTIGDYIHGLDHIALSAGVFVGVTATGGALDAAEFVAGAPTTHGQYILYDASTGTLSYDRDGSGGHAAVIFAHVTPGLTLDASDFLVV